MEPTKSQIARYRYIEHFSPLNYAVSVQNHTLVFLDAPGFVEEDNKRSGHIQDYEPVKGGPMDFIKSINPGTVVHAYTLVF
jgi:ethanolamine phosphate phosphodiesterase